MRVLFVILALFTASPVPTYAQDDPPVEYKLAVIQTGGYVAPDDELVRHIGLNLDDLQDRCTESRTRLADLSVTIHDELAKRGIAEPHQIILSRVNEVAWEMMQADDYAGPDHMDCTVAFATYYAARLNT